MDSRPSFVATFLVAAAFLTASPASAQEAPTPAEAETAPSSAVITTMPDQAATSRDIWFAHDLADAKARSRRALNALIATSATFGLGAILTGIGFSQCQVISQPNQYDELLCNNAGDVLVPLGGTIAGLSAIGMITSGIILGVSNKRKREIERDMRRAYYGSRLKWDIPSGALVF